MRKLLGGTALALAIGLAGCGEEAADTVTNIQVPSSAAYQERLLELNDMARNAVFLRALMDAERDCQQVVQSSYVGQYQGQPAWFAVCRNRGEWLVLIGNDGVAQVLSRSGAEAAGIVEGGDGAVNGAAPAQ